MGLPEQPITIHGGCNCRAIRYKVDIPAISERPLHPTTDVGNPTQEEVRLPFVCICHCNDCRRATGSILFFVLCSPTTLVSASCLPRSASADRLHAAKAEDDSQDDHRPWIPAADVFKPWPGCTDTFLASYQSSEGRTRFFCGRCGTNLAYVADPMPAGWPDMLDLVLGTFDRKYLELDWLEPERHVWWDRGVEWIKRFAAEGAGGLTKHPSYKVNESV